MDTIVFVFGCPAANAQERGQVQFSVQINSTQMDRLRIYKYGISEQLTNTQLDTSISIKPFKTYTFSLSIPYEGVYGIQDNMLSSITHQLFISPGDTISLIFNPRENYKEQLKKPHPVLTRRRMIVKAKYPGNITFFDSLALGKS